MLNWMSFPKNKEIEPHLLEIVRVMENKYDDYNSEHYTLKSNEVLNIVACDLELLGYRVEKGKKKNEKIHVPVLYELNGKTKLSFDVDAYCKKTKTVIEIEAGRAVDNYQFLKDFYQVCMMQSVDYLCVAVRNIYRTKKDFEKVCNFFDALYLSNRMEIPLKGILILGY